MGATRATTSQLGLIRWAARMPKRCSRRCSAKAIELQPLKRLIIERTGGNPFFIEEMVQALFDEGALVRNGAVKVDALALATALAADGAGDTGRAHRPAVGASRRNCCRRSR